jgi:hypothetical protein
MVLDSIKELGEIIQELFQYQKVSAYKSFFSTKSDYFSILLLKKLFFEISFGPYVVRQNGDSRTNSTPSTIVIVQKKGEMPVVYDAQVCCYRALGKGSTGIDARSNIKTTSSTPPSILHSLLHTLSFYWGGVCTQFTYIPSSWMDR